MTLLLDGGTATELQRRGVPVHAPGVLRTVRGRAALSDVHASYVEAGARLVTANTFRCNLRALRRAGLDSAAAARMVHEAVRVARRAAGTALVAGSMAPVEDCYRPDLVPGSADLRAEHGWLAGELVAAGVDVILVETMNSLREARLALAAALSVGARAYVSFVAGPRAALLSGEPIAPAVRVVERDGAAGVLVNCTTVAGTEACLRAMRAVTGGPVGAYPNLENRNSVPAVGAGAYARIARRWCAEFDLDLVGGCCGSTPEHIRAVKTVLDMPGRQA